MAYRLQKYMGCLGLLVFPICSLQICNSCFSMVFTRYVCSCSWAAHTNSSSCVCAKVERWGLGIQEAILYMMSLLLHPDLSHACIGKEDFHHVDFKNVDAKGLQRECCQISCYSYFKAKDLTCEAGSVRGMCVYGQRTQTTRVCKGREMRTRHTRSSLLLDVIIVPPRLVPCIRR